MTSKTIIIGLVALAFVAGSIMTGTMAEAKKDKSEGNDNNPFKALWDGIENIELTPGPQGDPGPQGATGADGTDGLAFPNVYTNSGTPISVPHLVQRIAAASCQAGDVAIAPSWISSGTSGTGILSVETATLAGPTATYVVNGFQQTQQFTPLVICVDLS